MRYLALRIAAGIVAFALAVNLDRVLAVRTRLVESAAVLVLCAVAVLPRRRTVAAIGSAVPTPRNTRREGRA